MNFTWAGFKAMKIPLWETITGMGVAVGITWAAFAWADELEDKQKVTQGQLDQLVTIVSKTATDSNQIHRMNRDDIDEAQREFELLKQEIELRRELEERENRDDT